MNHGDVRNFVTVTGPAEQEIVLARRRVTVVLRVFRRCRDFQAALSHYAAVFEGELFEQVSKWGLLAFRYDVVAHGAGFHFRDAFQQFLRLNERVTAGPGNGRANRRQVHRLGQGETGRVHVVAFKKVLQQAIANAHDVVTSYRSRHRHDHAEAWRFVSV